MRLDYGETGQLDAQRTLPEAPSKCFFLSAPWENATAAMTGIVRTLAKAIERRSITRGAYACTREEGRVQ